MAVARHLHVLSASLLRVASKGSMAQLLPGARQEAPDVAVPSPPSTARSTRRPRPRGHQSRVEAMRRQYLAAPLELRELPRPPGSAGSKGMRPGKQALLREADEEGAAFPDRTDLVGPMPSLPSTPATAEQEVGLDEGMDPAMVSSLSTSSRRHKKPYEGGRRLALVQLAQRNETEAAIATLLKQDMNLSEADSQPSNQLPGQPTTSERAEDDDVRGLVTFLVRRNLYLRSAPPVLQAGASRPTVDEVEAAVRIQASYRGRTTRSRLANGKDRPCHAAAARFDLESGDCTAAAADDDAVAAELAAEFAAAITGDATSWGINLLEVADEASPRQQHRTSTTSSTEREAVASSIMADIMAGVAVT